MSEEVVQCIWYDQLFAAGTLQTDRSQPVKVLSPGWWNREGGPDFKGAQLEINGKFLQGDVEIHLKHGGWKQHGHHLDDAYDNVILHVVLESTPPNAPARNTTGKSIPALLLRNFLEEDVREIADRLPTRDYPFEAKQTRGYCAGIVEAYGEERMTRLLHLAGDWRMVFKARSLRERMDRVGVDQSVYEAVLTACGFAQFKHHFRAIGESLHYERARQLAQDDTLLLEAAYLRLAGLVPKELPEGTGAVPHFGRVRALCRDRLSGMRPLPLTWKRASVRPTNSPERRLAGAARFIARTSDAGLVSTLDEIWAADMKPLARRRAFEDLFPRPMGFWSNHCTWTGNRMQRPSAMIGAGRIRSIIGNVFVPYALASARRDRDRLREERVLEFFARLPQEPENKIQKVMLPRVFGNTRPPRLDFRTQQGLLQLHADWCEANPSCRNCNVIRFLDVD